MQRLIQSYKLVLVSSDLTWDRNEDLVYNTNGCRSNGVYHQDSRIRNLDSNPSIKDENPKVFLISKILSHSTNPYFSDNFRGIVPEKDT